MKKRSSYFPANTPRLQASFRKCPDVGVDEDTIVLGYYVLWLVITSIKGRAQYTYFYFQDKQPQNGGLLDPEF